MSLSENAQTALDWLERAPGAVLRRVNTYDRGDVAQVVSGSEGLFVTDVTIIDELLEAGAIEATAEVTRYVIHAEGQTVVVPPDTFAEQPTEADAFNVDTAGHLIQAVPDKAAAFQPKKAKK